MFPSKCAVAVTQEEEDDDANGFEFVTLDDVQMPEAQRDRSSQRVCRPRLNSNAEIRMPANPVVSSSQERALMDLMNSSSGVAAAHEESRCPDEEVLVTCDASIFRQVPDTYSTFAVPDENADVAPMPLSQEFLSQGTVYSLNEDNISLPNLPSNFMEGDLSSYSPAGSQTLSSGSMTVMDTASAEMDTLLNGSIDQVAP